jgi:hypothetical protein
MSKRLAYICAPYRGDTQANTEVAVELARRVKREFVPVVPHVAVPHVEEDEEAAMRMCIALLRACDVVVAADCPPTAGMAEELREARRLGMETVYISAKQEVR